MGAPILGEGYCGNAPCGDVGEKAGAEIDGRLVTGKAPCVGVGVPGDCAGPEWAPVCARTAWAGSVVP